ncbi:MAG: ArsR/SmtB family transcription factor [Halobacteria archaeon]
MEKGSESKGEPGYEVFDALKSRDCRKILELASEYVTANELSEESGIPRSTIYRKIEMLVDSDLLEESIKLRSDGRHTKTYRRRITSIKVGLTDNGIEVQAKACDGTQV